MEDHFETSLAVTMPAKWDRSKNFGNRSQNMWTIYNAHEFFKDISEQPEDFNNTNVHKMQGIIAEPCDVHYNTVHKSLL
jgi:hypothetical protein